MTDIVERLRLSVTKGHEPTDEDAVEAADEIERLEAAINTQGAEIDRLCKMLLDRGYEIERLRKALDEVAE